MRKEEIASLVVYLVMIAIAVIVGLTVVSDAMFMAPKNMNNMLFVIITIVVALLFNIIMLEVLHIIGGKIGGYKVVSVNILGFQFEKLNGKFVFKFKDFDGLTGETKLAPKRENASLKSVIWLPLFGYAAELAGGIVLYTSMVSAPSQTPGRWLGICAILFVILSSMIALYNLIPLKLDSMTDGYKLVLIAKKANVEAMNELMRVEELQREGKEVTDIKIFEEITEFTANLNLISVYNNLKAHNYEEAERIIDINLKDPKKVEPYTYNRMIAQKLYIETISKDIGEAKSVYQQLADDKIRRFIANDSEMESIRAYVLIAGVLEGSQGEVRYAASKKAKAIKKVFPSKVETEEQLYKDAINKVYEVHPEWKQEENAAN